MQTRIIILLSEKEEFYQSAVKIKQICNYKTEILFIESIIDDIDYFQDTDIIFILANGPLVYKFVDNMKNKKCHIINKEFFLKNYSKQKMQVLLEENNIKVPKIFKPNELDKNQLPIFVKENTHAGIVFQAYTDNTLKQFFSKFNINDFYLEENVAIKDKHSIEYKLYIANRKAFFKDNTKCEDKKITKVVLEVAKILKMDAMSIDIIISNNQVYIIDVNSAPGYYYCSNARLELVHYMEGIL